MCVSAVTTRRVLGCVCAVALLAGAARAQGGGEPSVEGRLLQILRDKGVISEGEMAELSALERELRERDSIEVQLRERVGEMVASLDDGSPRVAHRPGRGFSFTSADKAFRLNIGGRIQVRFTYDFWQENASTDRENRPDFDVPRARLDFTGHAFHEHLKYRIHFDVAGDRADTPVTFPGAGTVRFASGNRLAELKDAYIDYVKWPELSLRAGQFKTPYSRQFLTSSAQFQMVERSPVHRAFIRDRDVGLMVFGAAGSGENAKLIEYYAGIFDGEGENSTNNDKGLLYVGRVAVNPFGEVAYTESALKQTEDFRLAVGLNAWLHQDDNHRGEGDDWAIGFDVAIFWCGFFATAEFHYRENDAGGGPDVRIVGWSAQAGYFIIPEEFEVSLRYVEVDWDNNGTGTAAQREYLVGLGYFFEGHAMKIQTDFGWVEAHFGNHANNTEEWRWRLQFQLVF